MLAITPQPRSHTQMPPEPPKAVASTPDQPLDINGIEIPCYVLDNEMRVLTEEGFLQAVGRHPLAKAGTGTKAVATMG